MRGAARAGLLLLAAGVVLRAQSPVTDLSLSNLTITSGTTTYQASNSITASTVTVSGSASVTLQAGNLVRLTPGFQATAGSASPTFRAVLGTPVCDAPPVNVSVSPASNTTPATSGRFSFTSSANSAACIDWMEMNVNYDNVAAGGCFLAYWPGSNTVALAGDDGYTWPMSGALGSATVLQNSQCSVNLATSTVDVSSTGVTLNLDLTFLAGLPGMQKVFLQTGDVNGLMASWQQMGTWLTTAVVSGLPSGVSIGPSSGTGLQRTFTYVGSSVNSSAYITAMVALIGTSSAYPAVNACYVYFDRSTNILFLLGNSGAWDGTTQQRSIGVTGTMSNSQCTVDAGASSASGSGNNVTLNLALSFNASWGGVKGNYLWVYDRAYQASGWYTGTPPATWTVGTPVQPSESITAPQVSGVSSGNAGRTYAYTTSGATSSLAHPVQYLFDWGDGSTSGWLAVGVATAGKTWSTANSYAVRVQARCAYDPAVVSSPSLPLTVTISPAVSVSIAPGAGSLGGGQSQQFTAAVYNAASTSVTWSVSGPGSVTSSGLYSAPGVVSSPQTAIVVATSVEDPTKSATAVITLAPAGSVSITTSPVAIPITVDGVVCTAPPCTYQWSAGTSHTVSVPVAPQAGGSGIQYVYSSWSDGGAAAHTVAAPAGGGSYVANFTTQYYLLTAVNVADWGRISPVSGWRNSGETVPVSATANPGYQFGSFSGALSGATTPQSVMVNAPTTVTANFAPPLHSNTGDVLSADSKQPPAAGGVACGGQSTCSIAGIQLEFASPNQARGSATTATVGPNDWMYVNYASVKMYRNGVDIGSACAGETSAYYGATARVPCNGTTFLVAVAQGTSPNFYGLIATHRTFPAGAEGTFNTYVSLGFVPAGASTVFTVPLDVFSNTANASTPTVSPSDGLAVSYVQKAAGSVTVNVTAPASTVRGGHAIGFPAVDSYNQVHANQALFVVVYDPTPAISATPASVTAGVPTALTITGTGFGDHPTVYVAGAQYNPGTPVRDTQGRDVVTLNVTLPLSSANSPVPVYLVSNGSGGRAFFGAPLGAAGQGSPQSNTVQIQAVAGPTITSFLPTEVSAGVSTYMFNIAGINLMGSGGVPTLTFGNSGIAYTVESHDDYSVKGWLNTTNAVPGHYTVTLTPAGATQAATASITVTAGPGSITAQYPQTAQGRGPMSDYAGIWWLGTAAIDSNDGCDPNRQVFLPGDVACYWTWVKLTAAPGVGSPPPSETSPITWTFTDAATNQPSSNVTFVCQPNTACSQISLKPANAFYGTVTVRAIIGGVPSAIFTVGIDYPDRVDVFRTVDRIMTRVNYPAYESDNYIRLFSKGGQRMYYMPVHEEFPSPSSWSRCGGSIDWTQPITQTDPNPDPINPDPTKRWGAWITDADGILSNTLGQGPDTVGYACQQGTGCSPASDIPGTSKTPPQALSAQANAWSYQFFYIGSQDIVPLGKYLAVVPRKQVRYTDHGRDEVQEWSCPQ